MHQFHFILDCLKTNFKTYSIPGKESKKSFNGYKEKFKYPHCTMPWHNSMLGKHTDGNEINFAPCNVSDAYILYALDYEFMEMGVNERNPSCLGLKISYICFLTKL